MQKWHLEKRLKELGFWFLKHGGGHDAWTNGKIKVWVPRHADIKEGLAKAIIKQAGG